MAQSMGSGGCGCGGGGAIATSGSGSLMPHSGSLVTSATGGGTLSPNNGGVTPTGYIIPDSSQNPFEVPPTDCLTEIGNKTDILISQASTFELRVCLHGVIEQIRCFETNSDLTLPLETCLEAGNVVEIACISDCSYTQFEGEHEIATISDDRLTATLTPVPTAPLESRCFTSQPPVIGCVSVQAEKLPAIIELESIENINFYGNISRSLQRREKDFGINTISGSNYLQTTVLDLVRIGDRITVPSANIDNAEVLNVERLSYNGQTVDVIEIEPSQTPDLSGCFAATTASGSVIHFSTRVDGSCIVFYLSNFLTSRMIPLGQVGANQDGSVIGHYGFYNLGYSAVIADPNDATMVYPVNIPIMSGRVLVEYSSMASMGVF